MPSLYPTAKLNKKHPQRGYFNISNIICGSVPDSAQDSIQARLPIAVSATTPEEAQPILQHLDSISFRGVYTSVRSTMLQEDIRGSRMFARS